MTATPSRRAAFSYARNSLAGLVQTGTRQIVKRLHGRVAGTGMGLAISKRIVELHGGRIWLRSEAGKGAAVRFTIPIRN